MSNLSPQAIEKLKKDILHVCDLASGSNVNKVRYAVKAFFEDELPALLQTHEENKRLRSKLEEEEKLSGDLGECGGGLLQQRDEAREACRRLREGMEWYKAFCPMCKFDQPNCNCLTAREALSTTPDFDDPPS